MRWSSCGCCIWWPRGRRRCRRWPRPPGLRPSGCSFCCRGGAALKLLTRRRDGQFDLAVRGAAFLAVPGLEAMVGHHHVLYRDLADPVAFLKGETEPELARFWPYVFGAGGATDPR